MKHRGQTQILVVALSLMLSLGVLSFTRLGVQVAAQGRAIAAWMGMRETIQSKLASALNPDGTLKPGIQGSFDTNGYGLKMTSSGAPSFVPTTMQSGCGGWNTQFALPNGVSGGGDIVRVMLVNGTDIYIGGSFTAAGNAAANNVVKYNTSANTWSALGSGNGNGVNNIVLALALDGSDLYVGGQFTTANVGGTNILANRVAKFNTSTNTWSGLGASGGNGVNSTVNALAVNGSDLFVGGLFTTANLGGTNAATNRIAKLNTSTNNWSALGTGGGNGLDNGVSALLVNGGKLYLGGTFTTANVGGTTVTANHIIRFDPSTNAWEVMGTGGGNGVNSDVSAMALTGNDLYIGGLFNTANIGGSTVSASGLAKYNVLTGAWTSLPGQPIAPPGQIFSMTISGNDLYVGGLFQSLFLGLQTLTVNNVAKYSITSSAWSAMGTSGGAGIPYDSSSVVYSLAAVGSDTYIGGDFSIANSGGTTVNAKNIAKFNSTTGWSGLNTGGLGIIGTVYALAASGTDLYVGGDFTLAGNLAVNYIAKLNTLTNTWSALGTGGGNGVNYIVRALALSGNDLYVGGDFGAANIGGAQVSALRVAKYNTLTGAWSALGTSGGNGVGDSNSPSDILNALATMGNDLYVAGKFTIVNSGGPTVSVNHIAKYNASSGWGPVGTGGGNGVDALVNYSLLANGNDFYLGGSFGTANIGGTTVSVRNVAKFNSTTGWSGLIEAGGSDGPTLQVYALAANGSDIYVGGNFPQLNLVLGVVNKVAKFNTATNTWGTLGTGGGKGVSGDVNALLSVGTDVYLGGAFATANVGGTTVSANRLVKYDTLTGNWSALGTASNNGANSNVNALAIIDGKIYAGGVFNVVGGNVASSGIAQFCPSASPPTIAPASPLARTQGSAASNSTIATVSDSNAGMLTVQATTIPTGITITNIVNTSGTVTADVAATCAATPGANTVVLTVTNASTGLSNTANLTVNVTANSVPTLTYALASVSVGGATTNSPSTATDNGSISSYAVQSQGTYTGTISVNASGVVSLSNAAPVGSHTIIIRATDNCGATTDATFSLTVTNTNPTISPQTGMTRNQGSGSSNSQIATVNDTESGANGVTVKVNNASSATVNGVTVSNISNSGGTVTADIVAICGASNASFTLTATDGNNATATATLNVSVTGITLSALVNGLTFVPYSQTLTASGGTGAYTFTLVSGTLPPGLTMNGNMITGTPTTAGASTFTIRADDDGNTCFGERAYTINIGSTGLMYYPLARPVRLLDTRPGASPNACFQPNAPITGGTSRLQPARGTCEGIVIPANATTITGHITTVQSGGGSLTLYPSDAPQPNVTNSNYLVNEILNNAFTVGLGVSDGAFKLFVSSNTDVVIDVTGYYAPPGAGGLYFHPLPKPIRLLETRTGFTGCQTPGAPLQTGTTRLQTGVLTCDGVTIPTGAMALVGNATTTNSTGSGYLTLWPADATQPFASSSNFATGVNRNAPFTVGLSLNGEFNIYTARTTDLVIDVMGYYSTQATDTNGQGLLFNSLGAPLRLMDTRAGQPACYQPGAPMTGGTVYTQETQIPCTNLTSAARALVGNVSALNASANGYLTFWPSNAAQPTVATSNYQTNRVFNRHFTVGLGNDVAFKRFAASTTDVIIDISGFFAP